MSSARIGAAPARPCAWSAAHWLTSRPRRSDQARVAQPEPPASAFAMVVNFSAPCHDAAEIALERAGQSVGWLRKSGGGIVAVPAERIEIDLVQDHRAGGN